ncbi:MAG: hypothetical protein IK015_03680 [Treponema sp.]|nr:hypothetical protein [Treponema sp.]
MLIYFLGGESEFLHGSDFRAFRKIGSFAKAVKIQSPELIVVEPSYLDSDFSLQDFLCEQTFSIPVLFYNKIFGNGGEQGQWTIGNIPDKFFVLIKILFAAQKSKKLDEICARLRESGIIWSANCARVYLCRLKKFLRQQKCCGIDLIKENDGYRLAAIENSAGLSDQLVQIGIQL